MQPALFRVGTFPPPASGADVLAGPDCAGTGFAADRGVAAIVQRVVRHTTLSDAGPDLGPAPVGKRVEFRDAVHRVALAQWQFVPGHRLRTAQSRDPGVPAGKRPRQRLDLADIAAALAQIDALVESVQAVFLH